MFRKFGVPIAFFVPATFCSGLGAWQQMRSKEVAIKEKDIARRINLKPIQYKNSMLAEKENLFLPVFSTGDFKSDSIGLIGPVSPPKSGILEKEKIGYYVVSPLHNKDDTIVLVNRGWVSGNSQNIVLQKTKKLLPNDNEKSVEVSGIINDYKDEKVTIYRKKPDGGKYEEVKLERYITDDDINGRLRVIEATSIKGGDTDPKKFLVKHKSEFGKTTLNSKDHKYYRNFWLFTASSFVFIYACKFTPLKTILPKIFKRK